jgi:hypothetical protein
MSSVGTFAIGACSAWALLVVLTGAWCLVDAARTYRERRRVPSPEVQRIIDAERAALRAPGTPYVPGEQPDWHGCPAPHATGWDRAWEARGGIR